jgi:hypothetical protein
MLYGTPEKSSVDFLLMILQKVTLQHSTRGISHRSGERTGKAGKCSSVYRWSSKLLGNIITMKWGMS